MRKNKAYRELNRALKLGLLAKPAACERCEQSAAVEGHHDNYDKPLNVKWLCRKCHLAHHKMEGTGPWFSRSGPELVGRRAGQPAARSASRRLALCLPPHPSPHLAWITC